MVSKYNAYICKVYYLITIKTLYFSKHCTNIEIERTINEVQEYTKKQ